MNKNSFQHRLEENFTAYKNNIALAQGTHTMTYCDLDKKSGYIAHWLINKGMNKGAFIGILMNDRVRFIYTMIGILKAGCVFVSLDPSYPKNRLELMIKSTNTHLVLMDEINYRRFISSSGKEPPEEPRRDLICIDDLFLVKQARGAGGRAAVPYNREDPIYIYFTSGTSGAPKGILGKNRSLLHFINWEIKTFNIDETYGVSQLTTPGFDAFLRDIFVPLFSGGRICIPPDPDILLNPEQLIEWIEQAGIHLIHCVPGLFRWLNSPSASLSSDRFKELKYILLSGESIHPHDLTRWYETFSQRIQLVNLWGPTETTLIKSFYLISQSDVEKERIPIGKPMAGAQVIILDEAMNICKEGMTGKLYLRTPYRTYGYCNDPELTAKRFIKNPFNNDPTDLLYDTGDLGRLLSDGNIEFLGREDRQVKVMGVRIELAAIENVLLKHPAVNETVVVKHVKSPSISTTTIETAKGDEESLCAYITGKPTGETETPHTGLIEDVKSFLSDQLPATMIPAVLVEIEKIPRKPNGKVDYEALPDPHPDKKREYAAPVNEIQQELAEMWSDLLKIERISIHSHFFELGGNSLALMALVTKIHKVFDVRISLDQMFHNLTIEKLAAIITDTVKDKFFSIESVEKREYYVLSPAQQRIYFLHQVDKDSTAYNMPQVVSLSGELDKGRVEETFLKIIKKHESFRTTFEMIHGNPVQRVHENENLEFEISCLKCCNAEAENIIKKFFRPFHLNKAPLLRVDLLTIESTRQILLIDMHHIITDETSQILLEKEFKGLVYAEEEPNPLRLQYKDYAEWQNSQEQKSLRKKQEKYWLEVFEGEVPVLNIPTDYPRPLKQSFEGKTVEFVLTAKESHILRELAKETDTTLYMCILSVFTILLSRLSGQEDIVVGTPVAARRHADLEKIIGMFVNTLPMRNKPLAEKRCGEFLKEIKENTLKAYENQEYPFEDLVENVVGKRDLRRNPIFDIIFNLVNTGEYTYNSTEIEQGERNQYQHHEGTSKVDLILSALEAGERLLFTIEYCTRLFKPETINRLISYFKNLLHSISEDTDVRLFQLEIIPEEEMHRILYEFNDTASEYPPDKTLHQLFTEQAAKGGDRIALVGMVHGTGTGHFGALTYRELNERADTLACLLRNEGVSPDNIVGIMMERSVEMIIGIMAILKSGGAYLPIGPGYPEKRINYMLIECSAKILITTRNLLEGRKIGKAEDHESFKILFPDFSKYPPLHPSKIPALLPLSPVHVSCLAYIIYTSGSTGKPKGVIAEHHNVIGYINAFCKEFEVSSKDIVLQQASYTFDAFVEEVFPVLLQGGQLTIPTKDMVLDFSLLSQFIANHHVRLISCSPLMLDGLNRLENFQTISSVNTFISGGDILKRDYVDKLSSIGQVYNTYGPTETTVCVTYHKCSDKDYPHIPIGKPIANYRVYILGQYKKLVPMGVPGELCVSGIGTTRGYLNQPELTAEKFVHDLWDSLDYRHKRKNIPGKNPMQPCNHAIIRNHSPIPHSSLYPLPPFPHFPIYMTGDLARLLPDGNIEFLGRNDRQIKIRGFRIEPDEIENQLLKHEAIIQAAVRLKDNFLHAYIMMEKELTTSQLRNHLATKLPDYMIPAHFVQVEKIPLTANGKVDVKSLDLLGKKLESGIPYAPPQNEIERQISDAWKQVLDRNTVGIHDNYFELGGNSLDIVRICTRLKEIFKMEIPVVAMFTYPTVHSLAEYIINSQQEKAEEIRDRSAVLERSKMDRKEQFQRRKGLG